MELEGLHSGGDEEGGADHHVSKLLSMRNEMLIFLHSPKLNLMQEVGSE